MTLKQAIARLPHATTTDKGRVVHQEPCPRCTIEAEVAKLQEAK